MKDLQGSLMDDLPFRGPGHLPPSMVVQQGFSNAHCITSLKTGIGIGQT